jgi:hypothetical protein
LFSGETLYFSGVRLIYNMFLKMWKSIIKKGPGGSMS